jgi:23S rRNA pseudouridine2605 synthase
VTYRVREKCHIVERKTGDAPGGKLIAMSERIQKRLAALGLGSRREIEGWIASGRVRVNGKLAILGESLQGDERVTLDGREIDLGGVRGPRPRVLRYHKAAGTVTTRSDPEGRATVFQDLPSLRRGRWISVGRLDLNTAGLLLMTTDGQLADRLMHPSSRIEREYAVRVRGEVTASVIERLTSGVVLEDGPARFQRVISAGGTGANRWYHVVIAEGRKREVRRLWESQGLTVSRLIRVRYGPQRLPPWLRPGKWEEVTGAELSALYGAAGLAAPSRPKPASRGRRRRAPGRTGRRVAR